MLSDGDESEDGDYDGSENGGFIAADNVARDALRVKLQAEYLQGTQRLSEEELAAVLEPRRSDAAEPFSRYTVSTDVSAASASLEATGTLGDVLLEEFCQQAGR